MKRRGKYLVKLVRLLSASMVCFTLHAAIHPPTPGFNLFSPQHDIQIGREAAAQVRQQRPVVSDRDINSYIGALGQKLVRSKYAGSFPYSFAVVGDPSVNAFSVPGGPVFVNTGLFPMVENEGQLAGVLAHEISHVALRHGTNQASKAQFARIPMLLAGLFAGGSLLGQLTQLGVGLTANSVLLRFSREDETEADYLGALIMADAGYNPLEMARFFEKLQAKAGRQGILSQYLSDHPNPGNRVQAVEAEIRQMQRQQYSAGDNAAFLHIKDLVAHAPGPRELRSAYSDGHPTTPPPARPAGQMREYKASTFSLSYPDNWQAFGDPASPSVTIAPQQGVLAGANGTTQIGYGLIASYYISSSGLQAGTADLVRELQRQNTSMRQQGQRTIQLSGQPALLTTMNSQSPFRGETEVDAVVSVARPEGIFYMVFIAPKSEWSTVERTYMNVLSTVHFR